MSWQSAVNHKMVGFYRSACGWVWGATLRRATEYRRCRELLVWLLLQLLLYEFFLSQSKKNCSSQIGVKKYSGERWNMHTNILHSRRMRKTLFWAIWPAHLKKDYIRAVNWGICKIQENLMKYNNRSLRSVREDKSYTTVASQTLLSALHVHHTAGFTNSAWRFILKVAYTIKR